MAATRILIAGNEVVDAEGLRARLREMGYQVCGIATRGEKAVSMAGEMRPDVVLIDVGLDGDSDGIEAACELRSSGFCVVYLSDYQDQHTLERAKVSEPFGCVVESEDDKQLYAAIEIALYKHRQEQRLREENAALKSLIENMGEGLISTDICGDVVLMNRTAERLTGYRFHEAAGRSISKIFQIKNGRTGRTEPNPVMKAIRELRTVEVGEGTILVRKNGSELTISDSASPIIDRNDRCTGAVLIFRGKKVTSPQKNNGGTQSYQPFDNTSDGRLDLLTRREREVLRLIADGKCNKEAARELFISVRTVEFHRKRIMRKLEVDSTANLIKAAIMMGLTKVESPAVESDENSRKFPAVVSGSRR